MNDKAHEMRWANRIAVPLCALALTVALSARGQTPEAVGFFRQNCTSCHTIGGGRLTGPDLKNVTQRRDRAWLVRFLPDPKVMIDSDDPYAQKLQQEARGVIMTTIAGMTPARAESLLDLIEAESKLEKSQFVGSQMSDRPFTPRDYAEGRAIFSGDHTLKNGGPPCISCHTFRGVGGLGGGRLGPDLSLVYERLQGRKGLGAWLLNPASPTMQPIFRNRPLQPDEVLSLLSLFEDSARKGGVDDSHASVSFFLLGTGGAVFGLFTLDKIWKRRFRSVRRDLVHGKEARG